MEGFNIHAKLCMDVASACKSLGPCRRRTGAVSQTFQYLQEIPLSVSLVVAMRSNASIALSAITDRL